MPNPTQSRSDPLSSMIESGAIPGVPEYEDRLTYEQRKRRRAVTPHKPVPLSLMVRRLAPLVRDSLLGFTEVLDMLMEVALERGMCESFGRADAVQEWLMGGLTREAAQ